MKPKRVNPATTTATLRTVTLRFITSVSVSNCPGGAGAPSFPPHHVTSELVPTILISDDDRCRDELLQSKSSHCKSFVSRILISKFFDIRILRGISCYPADSKD